MLHRRSYLQLSVPPRYDVSQYKSSISQIFQIIYSDFLDTVYILLLDKNLLNSHVANHRFDV